MMKKTKLYILTFSAIALVTLVTALGSLRYYYVSAREALLAQKAQSGQREIRELGTLLEQQLQAGISSVDVIDNLQQSIQNTDVQSEFVCMYNTDGIELCHPDPSLIGRKIEAGNSSFSGSGSTQSFQDILKSGLLASGVRNFPEQANRSSEIVSVYPVKGTDWMLASHTNINALQLQLDNLYQRFLVGTIGLILVITGSSFWLIWMIYRKYETEMDVKISGLNEEINSLSMLNRQLELKQQHTENSPIPKKENTRKRLMTYQKDEIITIDTDEIVYIVLNDNGVSVITFQGNTYTINSSLDDLMKELDTEIFYRANRQYIVNVNAIESIWIYGRNQLRIATRPQCPEPIIISKNKVSEFKKWLDR
ncbi:LytR/AlgR family response regulator transcription factor [Parapedobacter koreensis]|uniref:LytTr DNA-binding domain-containing protein n=1 Tax=Parapedobacter koreensis TaxID=332977 RepID=A0A1H7JYR8_9SPHI|nr:LytTR family DNA-binding domain-containing protein [Parapedobacter koreensis]SEK79632.1 LytTr DNA-binding domain-containing protein [Parapedobacter koreensis]